MALELGPMGDGALLHELYTEDVIGWSPTLAISSRDELKDDHARRAGAFSEVDLLIDPIDVVEDRGYAEWVMSATHVGPFTIDGGATLQPSGRRLTLRGVTIAHFDGTLISSFHHYWDNDALLLELGRIQAPK